MKTPNNHYYYLIRPGSGWTATGPSPDRVLKKSRSLQAVLEAFNKTDGPAKVKDSAGQILESKIA